MTGKNFYNPSKSGNPGPGNYRPEDKNLLWKKEPSWRIGSSTREDNLNRVKKDGYPGPGNYGISSKAVEGRKFGFGTEKRGKNYKGYTPGPGQYHIPCSIVDVPKYMTYSTGFKEEYRFI